jgi:hypothetical protein
LVSRAPVSTLCCVSTRINHTYERQRVFEEWHRVLRPGARTLFTDSLTITGMIRPEEVLTRGASLGEQLLATEGRLSRLAYLAYKPA